MRPDYYFRNLGSSPRGRGTPDCQDTVLSIQRVIPAWAGNTSLRFCAGNGSAGHPRVGGEHNCHAKRAGHLPGHPRVGGEHRAFRGRARRRRGSSPRGRGTQRRAKKRRRYRRVIPAWAGNTSATPPRPTEHAGHPRVGGEHAGGRTWSARSSGSSPRGRGTHSLSPTNQETYRVIPAWAGNTQGRVFRARRSAGHPRVGGEHLVWNMSAMPATGSSPRGRGTRRNRRGYGPVRRVIPAWAGNTRQPMPAFYLRSGHPRVGGEHAHGDAGPVVSHGSSPRGRGTPCCPNDHAPPNRVIPAWAGNTAIIGAQPVSTTGHPRVGGEHRPSPRADAHAVGSSPRGRGTPRRLSLALARLRVIPAWAGNTPVAGLPPGRTPGHPRVGGEHGRQRRPFLVGCGSSPHGRGTQCGRSD